MERQFKGQTAIQIDGTKGWKLRPFLRCRDIEPYTPEELKAASMESESDGPFVDCAHKDIQVDVEGVEKVEGCDVYELKLTTKDGQVRHIWIDAQTLLVVKVADVRAAWIARCGG